LGWSPVISGVSLYRVPFLQMDSLAAGAFIATLPKLSSTQASHARRAACFMIVLTFVIGLTNQEVLKSRGINLAVFTFGFPHPLIQNYQEGWGYSLVAICSALSIFGLVNDSATTRHLFLESRLMVYLGRISFGLYVFSTPIISITGYLLEFQINSLRGFIIFCAQLAITFVAAHLSFQLYERRFLKLKQA
jgi:peptidoglycan/LPS O-acetylase OafA/YrhL